MSLEHQRDSTAVVRFIELQQQKPIFDPDAPKNVDTQVVKRPVSPLVRALRAAAVGLALMGVGFGIGLYVGQNSVAKNNTEATDGAVASVATTGEADVAPAPPSQPPPAEAMPLITPISEDDEIIQPDEMEPEFVGPAPQPDPEPAAEPKPRVQDEPESPPAPSNDKPARKKKKAKKKTKKTLDPRLGGGEVDEDAEDEKAEEATTGTLAVSAKPPCQIYIDGRNTGLKTPQRSIQLSPGKHRITLINSEHRINRSFSVNIVAGKMTRLVRDMMKTDDEDE